MFFLVMSDTRPTTPEHLGSKCLCFAVLESDFFWYNIFDTPQL